MYDKDAESLPKLLESSWLEELRYGRLHKVASSNFNWDEFSLVGKKIPLALLAVRLGPLGHGPGFRGVFRGRVKPCCFLLIKKRVVG